MQVRDFVAGTVKPLHLEAVRNNIVPTCPEVAVVIKRQPGNGAWDPRCKSEAWYMCVVFITVCFNCSVRMLHWRYKTAQSKQAGKIA